jgi:hypothetical protein
LLNTKYVCSGETTPRKVFVFPVSKLGTGVSKLLYVRYMNHNVSLKRCIARYATAADVLLEEQHIF